MEALQHEIRLNHYFGCGIAFEPDYFRSQGRWFEPYALYIDSTHCDIRQIGSEKHDYFTQDWYQKGLQQERGKGYLTDPYVDHEGAKRTVFTYAKPVFDRQGRKVGVFAMDFYMDWLQKAILEEKRSSRRWSNWIEYWTLIIQTRIPWSSRFSTAMATKSQVQSNSGEKPSKRY